MKQTKFLSEPYSSASTLKSVTDVVIPPNTAPYLLQLRQTKIQIFTDRPS